MEKEWLLQDIDSAIYYRSTRAEQYPHDTRNAEAVELLTTLKDHVAAMPDDNPLFQLVQLEADACDDFRLKLTDYITERLGRTGFDYDGDPQSFLDDLRDFVVSESA